ncbi:MAG: phytase [Candidatus Hydrogenedentes bacterium]|nr:phytase [Candidatus Hydrogenedentota bacterium]
MKFSFLILLSAAGIVMAQTPTVQPALETEPVPHGDDAADDACFWVHPDNPELSLIVGTDKEGGLAVYGLDGKQRQYLPDGKMNNVDIRYGFSLAGSPQEIVISSNRSDMSLSVYRVDPASLTLVSAGKIVTGMKLVYGFCMYRSAKTGAYFAFVNSEDGEVQQWKLNESQGKIGGELVRSFDVGIQTEGCVADDDTGVFYIGEEEKGIWRYGAEPDAGTDRELVDSVKPDGRLTADVEGLSIYYASATKGYLVASSQGDSTFAVYERDGNNKFLGFFQIGKANSIDPVTGTDGIDVISAALGKGFTEGAFIAQDDTNDGANQNFKLVPWQSIANAFTPALTIDTTRSPRL